MEVQKILITKQRFAWKLLSANFEFTSAYAGENINRLFNALDDFIKNPPNLINYLNTKKSW